jgi:hypothetical protein
MVMNPAVLGPEKDWVAEAQETRPLVAEGASHQQISNYKKKKLRGL